MRGHAQRGQVLPIWALGIVAMLIMILAVIRFADIVRWQIRAQNAADAAVNALVALQTQQFNEMNATLYAAAVDEFRIRSLLYGMELAAYGNGGCASDGSCGTRYASLYNTFLKAAARYKEEVVLLNRVSANMDATTLQSDALAMLAHLTDPAACAQNGGSGGDCAFSYALVNWQPRTPLYTVQMDARAFIKPSEGQHMTPVGTVNPSLEPVQAEVAVCADVPSPVPSILGFKPKPFRVIARAAATAVMMEQDWFQPGQLNNPWTGLRYQPIETPSGPSSDPNGLDWYAIDFGGNANKAYEAYNGYSFGIYENEFSAFLGWWNAVAIPPFSGPLPTARLGCSS